MIQSVVFDLGGVIIDHDIPECIRQFHALMGDELPFLGLQSDGEARGMQQSAEGASLMRDFELGYIHGDAFVQAVLPRCKEGTQPADIVRAWNAMHAGIPTERIEALKRLHETHRLYALSNNNAIHWADIHAHYPDFDDWFDAAFPSHLLHVGKPDRRIFELAESRIMQDYPDGAYRREETMFVDDLEANRLAAESFGWQSCPSLEQLLTLNI